MNSFPQQYNHFAVPYTECVVLFIYSSLYSLRDTVLAVMPASVLYLHAPGYLFVKTVCVNFHSTMLSRLHLARPLGRLVVPAILYLPFLYAAFCACISRTLCLGHGLRRQKLFSRLDFLSKMRKVSYCNKEKKEWNKIKQRGRKRSNEVFSFHKETCAFYVYTSIVLDNPFVFRSSFFHLI